MKIWSLLTIIAALGAIGGVANCAVAGEFVRPRFDPVNKSWRPGWLGNVIVGLIAAIVVGGMYGPLAQYVINTAQDLPQLTVAQLLGAVLVGMGGANILTQLAQRQADQLSKQNLTSALKSLNGTALEEHSLLTEESPAML